MNFFHHQEQARRKTTLLIGLFATAVIPVVAAVNLIAIGVSYGVLHYGSGSVSALASPPLSQVYSLEKFALVSLVTVGIIFFSSLFRQASLKGGHDIAGALGGVLIDPGTHDHNEKVLLNVVEEMAIAAGMPVPDVYILEENSINAFAAGYQPSDAVVGITRRTIEALNREQLQGVIAHEFSHIFNGDMRMNMRLTGILYGIIFIGVIGRLLLRSAHFSSGSRSRKKGNGAAIAAAGIGLMLVGYIGEFFGRMIQSAVSRQREFLADASAVQFTRNPNGIGDALKVIGFGVGSRIESPAAAEVSHFFFGSAIKKSSGFMATHPPLDERITRIEPQWNGHYLEPRQPKIKFDAQTTSNQKNSADTTLDVLTAAATAVSAIAGESESFAKKDQAAQLESALINANSAQSVAFSLLMLDSDSATEKRQQDLILKRHGQQVFRETLQFLPKHRQEKRSQRLILLERALPSLRRLSAKQYQDFYHTLVTMAQMDGRIELYEWCLYRLTLQYLNAHFLPLSATNKGNKQRHSSAHSVADDIAVIIAYVANAGHVESKMIDLSYTAAMLSGEFLMRPRDPKLHTSNSLKPLNKALTVLTETAPKVRERLIRALIVCIRHDHHITDDERDLIRTIAAILETPLGMFGYEGRLLLEE
ncbi:MAG: M48 family metallopeptidase [Oleibacter sp.]|nr:M48 family metallopeptidase [Thalassolituus sp.]